MELLKRFLVFGFAGIISLLMAGCDKAKDVLSRDDIISSSQVLTEDMDKEADIRGQTVTYLGTRDINPLAGEKRSSALAMFEDKYGGKVEYIGAEEGEVYEKLSQLLLEGQKVDMVAYDDSVWSYVVNGSLFQPIDNYVDLDNEIWEDVVEVADRMEYKKGHYVIPYEVLPDYLLQYSRTLVKSEGFEDPYILMQNGNWNWDTFLSMMNTFVERDTYNRYGITGWWQDSAVASCGIPAVTYNGENFVNNVSNAQFDKLGQFYEQIYSLDLYLFDDDWRGNYPTDNSVLFYAMGTWSLGNSNKVNADKDLFFVPFPKVADAEKYYADADISSYMLVKDSDKGDAVGTYLKCERAVRTMEGYTESAKAYEVSSGNMTSEQYDAIHSIFEKGSGVYPAFDFAYGMGDKMVTENVYTYPDAGVMDNISRAIISGDVSSWAEIKDLQIASADEAVGAFNASN